MCGILEILNCSDLWTSFARQHCFPLTQFLFCLYIPVSIFYLFLFLSISFPTLSVSFSTIHISLYTDLSWCLSVPSLLVFLKLMLISIKGNRKTCLRAKERKKTHKKPYYTCSDLKTLARLTSVCTDVHMMPTPSPGHLYTDNHVVKLQITF